MSDNIKAVCGEWTQRGYRDTCLDKTAALAEEFGTARWWVHDHPAWLGDGAFHASHRSNLLRKDPAWYGQFGWLELLGLPYVWPVRKGNTL